MIKVSVLYPAAEGARFDMDYYVDRHVAMIAELLGAALLDVEIDQGLAGAAPGSPPPFVAAVHMYFESMASFQTAFAPHAKAIRKDVSAYTDIRPQTQIATVVRARKRG